MIINMIAPTNFTIPPKAYGGEIFIWDIIESLSSLGHTVNLFAVPNSKTPKNGHLYPLRNSRNDWTRISDAELDVLRHYQHILKNGDIIHDFSHRKQVADWAYWNLDKKCLSTLWGSTWDRPLHHYNIVVWSKSHKNQGINGKTGWEDSGHEQLGFTSGKIPDAKIVYGGINTNFYRPNSDSPDDYFIYFGRPHPSKGVDTAIRLAKELNFNLKLCWNSSESQDHQYYEQLYLNQIKDSENIEFIELPNNETHHEIKRYLIQHAKASLLLPSYHECFGITYTESLACGTPVITTSKGAAPEIIEHTKTGFICDDYQSIKTAIQNIDYIDRQVCRDNTVDKFDRSRVAQDYLYLYNQILEGKEW